MSFCFFHLGYNFHPKNITKNTITQNHQIPLFGKKWNKSGRKVETNSTFIPLSPKTGRKVEFVFHFSSTFLPLFPKSGICVFQ